MIVKTRFLHIGKCGNGRLRPSKLEINLIEKLLSQVLMDSEEYFL
jgi:hypothetical protein